MPKIHLTDEEVTTVEKLSPLKGDEASTTVKLRLVLDEATRRQVSERSDVVQKDAEQSQQQEQGA